MENINRRRRHRGKEFCVVVPRTGEDMHGRSLKPATTRAASVLVQGQRSYELHCDDRAFTTTDDDDDDETRFLN